LGRGAYAVRRVQAVLARSNDPDVASVSLKLVRVVMAELGLTGLPAAPLQKHHTAGAEATVQPWRYHLHQNCRAAVSCHGDRLLHPAGDRLVDGR
jgi:hypothetical protein